MACIYQITSKTTTKKYIGSAIDFHKRKYHHLWHLEKNTHHSKKLQNHYNLYKDDLIFSILEDDISDEIIYSIEQNYLNELFNTTDSSYIFNTSKSATHASGWHHSQETKDRIVASRSWYKHTDETKLKISNAQIGKVLSDEHRAKLSVSAKLRLPTFLGKSHRDTTKQMISLSKLGKPIGNQKIVVCDICGKAGGVSLMKRYHFDNCKK